VVGLSSYAAFFPPTAQPQIDEILDKYKALSISYEECKKQLIELGRSLKLPEALLEHEVKLLIQNDSQNNFPPEATKAVNDILEWYKKDPMNKAKAISALYHLAAEYNVPNVNYIVHRIIKEFEAENSLVPQLPAIPGRESFVGVENEFDSTIIDLWQGIETPETAFIILDRLLIHNPQYTKNEKAREKVINPIIEYVEGMRGHTAFTPETESTFSEQIPTEINSDLLSPEVQATKKFRAHQIGLERYDSETLKHIENVFDLLRSSTISKEEAFNKLFLVIKKFLSTKKNYTEIPGELDAWSEQHTRALLNAEYNRIQQQKKKEMADNRLKECSPRHILGAPINFSDPAVANKVRRLYHLFTNGKLPWKTYRAELLKIGIDGDTLPEENDIQNAVEELITRVYSFSITWSDFTRNMILLGKNRKDILEIAENLFKDNQITEHQLTERTLFVLLALKGYEQGAWKAFENFMKAKDLPDGDENKQTIQRFESKLETMGLNKNEIEMFIKLSGVTTFYELVPKLTGNNILVRIEIDRKLTGEPEWSRVIINGARESLPLKSKTLKTGIYNIVFDVCGYKQLSQIFNLDLPESMPAESPKKEHCVDIWVANPLFPEKWLFFKSVPLEVDASQAKIVRRFVKQIESVTDTVEARTNLLVKYSAIEFLKTLDIAEEAKALGSDYGKLTPEVLSGILGCFKQARDTTHPGDKPGVQWDLTNEDHVNDLIAKANNLWNDRFLSANVGENLNKMISLDTFKVIFSLFNKITSTVDPPEGDTWNVEDKEQAGTLASKIKESIDQTYTTRKIYSLDKTVITSIITRIYNDIMHNTMPLDMALPESTESVEQDLSKFWDLSNPDHVAYLTEKAKQKWDDLITQIISAPAIKDPENPDIKTRNDLYLEFMLYGFPKLKEQMENEKKEEQVVVEPATPSAPAKARRLTKEEKAAKEASQKRNIDIIKQMTERSFVARSMFGNFSREQREKEWNKIWQEMCAESRDWILLSAVEEKGTQIDGKKLVSEEIQRRLAEKMKLGTLSPETLDLDKISEEILSNPEYDTLFNFIKKNWVRSSGDLNAKGLSDDDLQRETLRWFKESGDALLLLAVLKYWYMGVHNERIKKNVQAKSAGAQKLVAAQGVTLDKMHLWMQKIQDLAAYAPTHYHAVYKCIIALVAKAVKLLSIAIDIANPEKIKTEQSFSLSKELKSEMTVVSPDDPELFAEAERLGDYGHFLPMMLKITDNGKLPVEIHAPVEHMKDITSLDSSVQKVIRNPALGGDLRTEEGLKIKVRNLYEGINAMLRIMVNVQARLTSPVQDISNLVALKLYSIHKKLDEMLKPVVFLCENALRKLLTKEVVIRNVVGRSQMQGNQAYYNALGSAELGKKTFDPVEGVSSRVLGIANAYLSDQPIRLQKLDEKINLSDAQEAALYPAQVMRIWKRDELQQDGSTKTMVTEEYINVYEYYNVFDKIKKDEDFQTFDKTRSAKIIKTMKEHYCQNPYLRREFENGRTTTWKDVCDNYRKDPAMSPPMLTLKQIEDLDAGKLVYNGKQVGPYAVYRKQVKPDLTNLRVDFKTDTDFSRLKGPWCVSNDCQNDLFIWSRLVGQWYLKQKGIEPTSEKELDKAYQECKKVWAKLIVASKGKVQSGKEDKEITADLRAVFEQQNAVSASMHAFGLVSPFDYNPGSRQAVYIINIPMVDWAIERELAKRKGLPMPKKEEEDELPSGGDEGEEDLPEGDWTEEGSDLEHKYRDIEPGHYVGQAGGEAKYLSNEEIKARRQARKDLEKAQVQLEEEDDIPEETGPAVRLTGEKPALPEPKPGTFKDTQKAFPSKLKSVLTTVPSSILGIDEPPVPKLPERSLSRFDKPVEIKQEEEPETALVPSSEDESLESLLADLPEGDGGEGGGESGAAKKILHPVQQVRQVHRNFLDDFGNVSGAGPISPNALQDTRKFSVSSWIEMVAKEFGNDPDITPEKPLHSPLTKPLAWERLTNSVSIGAASDDIKKGLTPEQSKEFDIIMALKADPAKKEEYAQKYKLYISRFFLKKGFVPPAALNYVAIQLKKMASEVEDNPVRAGILNEEAKYANELFGDKKWSEVGAMIISNQKSIGTRK
jgi:hypothetical protein